MPRINLGAPYDHYIESLIRSGLFSTYTEVLKDALRLHMEHYAKSNWRKHIIPQQEDKAIVSSTETHLDIK